MKKSDRRGKIEIKQKYYSDMNDLYFGQDSPTSILFLSMNKDSDYDYYYIEKEVSFWKN